MITLRIATQGNWGYSQSGGHERHGWLRPTCVQSQLVYRVLFSAVPIIEATSTSFTPVIVRSLRSCRFFVGRSNSRQRRRQGRWRRFVCETAIIPNGISFVCEQILLGPKPRSAPLVRCRIGLTLGLVKDGAIVAWRESCRRSELATERGLVIKTALGSDGREWLIAPKQSLCGSFYSGLG